METAQYDTHTRARLISNVSKYTCAKVHVYAVARAPYGRRAHHGLTRDRHLYVSTVSRTPIFAPPAADDDDDGESTASAPPRVLYLIHARDTRAFAARADDTRWFGRRRRRRRTFFIFVLPSDTSISDLFSHSSAHPTTGANGGHIPTRVRL